MLLIIMGIAAYKRGYQLEAAFAIAYGIMEFIMEAVILLALVSGVK